MTNADMQSRIEESEDRELGFFDRFLGVFISPRSTMQNIAAFPTWLPPLIIVTIVAAASGFLLKDVILETQLEEMRNNPDMTQEQLNQAIPMLEKTIPISSVVAPAIITPIIYAAVAGLLLFVGSFMMGGESKYKTLFSVTCWSGIVTLVGSLVNVPAMRSRGVMESVASLNVLLPASQKETVLYNLLTQIDLFTLWWVAVIGFGFAAAFKFDTRKAMITAFSLWAIYAVIAVSLKAAFS